MRRSVDPVAGRRRAASALVAMVGLLLLLAQTGCSEPSTTLDSAATERAVRKAVGDRIEAPVSEVRCPRDIARGLGKRFSCRAVLEGDAGEVRLRVRQVDAGGMLQAELLDAVIDNDEVADDLRSSLVRTYLRGFTVDCGDGGPRVVALVTPFTCDAKDSSGSRTVEVTVVDAAGTLRYDVGD